jgi:tetratricopeptide (TPR) repeat protein
MVKGRATRRIGWALAGALLLLTVLYGPTTALARPPCQRAWLLLHAGLLQEAATEYHAVAQRVHDRTVLNGCVARGLDRVRDVRVDRAKTLARTDDAGRLSDHTIERLRTAVRIAPTADLVPRIMARGLTRRGGTYGIDIAMVLHEAGYNADASAVVRATMRRFPLVDVPPELRGLGNAGLDMAEARALSRAGFDDAAVAKLKQALATDPTVAVPPELVQDDHRLSWWHRWRGWLGPWFRSVGELVLLVLAAIAVVMTIRWLYRRVASNRLSIKSFTATDTAHGSATATSVRENYVRMSRSNDRRGLKHIDSGPEAFEGLPAELTDVIAQARFVDAALQLADRLTSRWVWKMTGELRPAHPKRGVGLWLSLSKGRKDGDEVTIWEEDFWPWEVSRNVTQESYDRLTVPAAAWLLYATAGGRRSFGDGVHALGRRRRKRRERDFRALGTDRWRSYALSEVGSDLQARGDPERARRCFERALGVDPRNRAARLSLAVADAQEPVGSRRYQRALSAFEQLAGQEEDSRRKLWYSVRYGHAVALLRPGAGWFDKARDVRARQRAVETCATIAFALHQIESQPAQKRRGEDKQGRQERERQLKLFLDHVEPLALLVLASALQRAPANVSAAGARWDQGTHAERERLRRLLLAAHDGRAAPRGITHEDIVRYVYQHHALRSEVRYGLACYYVRVDDLKSAQDELDAALERGDPGLRRQACDDPALRDYRDDPEYGRAFEELLERLERHPDAPEQANHAERLRGELTRLFAFAAR